MEEPNFCRRGAVVSSRMIGVLCVLCAFTTLLPGQIYSPGPQVLTFLSDVDDSDQPYGLYLPKNFDSTKKYPLVISLHGAWSNHRLNLKRVFGKGNQPGETDAEATRYFPPFREVDYIVASPYARGTMGYQGIAERDVYAVLADVKRRFSIDDDRVYLTGLSMGGGGTFWLGLTRPDLWAAIAPVCAAAPKGSEDLAGNALNVAVHLFHGDQDPAVPVEQSRKWHKTLLNLGVNSEYVEYPGVRHNSWENAYKDGAIFDWFDKFRRNRYPERVRFATRAYKYDSAYWVRIDGLTPGTLASIDARFTAKNRIEVKTTDVDGFTLKLEGHPQFVKDQALIVTVDGKPAKLKPRHVVSFAKAGEAWKEGLYSPVAGAKRPGLEGPISEAIASRHVYIYGTAGAGGDEELRARRDQAHRAGEWSTPQLKLLLNFQVVADKDVGEKDLAGVNPVLFGTRETNTLLARYAGRLPLELNAGAADYGLVFVAPLDGRYVVVSSGLPWWTGAAESQRGSLRFLPPAYRVLQSFPDFVLFKGTLNNVIAEGRFDRDWKVPPDAAEKMSATGAVKVR
jgi:pimeloyl-ACP methyl ester carboxylesterase